MQAIPAVNASALGIIASGATQQNSGETPSGAFAQLLLSLLTGEASIPGSIQSQLPESDLLALNGQTKVQNDNQAPSEAMLASLASVIAANLGPALSGNAEAATIIEQAAKEAGIQVVIKPQGQQQAVVPPGWTHAVENASANADNAAFIRVEPEPNGDQTTVELKTADNKFKLTLSFQLASSSEITADKPENVTANNIASVQLEPETAETQALTVSLNKPSGQARGKIAPENSQPEEKQNSSALNTSNVAYPVSVKPEAAPVDNTAAAAKPVLTSTVEVAENIVSQARIVTTTGGSSYAEMQLQPKELGQLLVSVRVENGQINLNMVAQSNTAQQAIIDKLPDLANAIAAAGLTLAQVNVSVNDQQKQRNPEFTVPKNERKSAANPVQTVSANKGWLSPASAVDIAV